MSHTWNDRVVVVTGASAGVGRSIAREFAQQGARLGLIARGSAGLEAARLDAVDLGARNVAVAAVDVGDAEQVRRAAEMFDTELGPVDVWVNNAMASVFAPVRNTTPAEFRRVTEVTYLGYVHGTLMALERMLPRDQGTIVQVGSALAYRGIPYQAPYCAAKHAVQGFTESLRCELLADGSGVRLTMVQLPGLNTPQFGWVRTRLPRHPKPVPPFFQPEVAARAVAWAADHAPRELNVGTATVLTRLANRTAPGLLDHYLARTGFDSQQTNEPVDLATRRDNLERPLDEHTDRGAYGRYSGQAKRHSAQLWATTHRLQSGALAAGAALLAGFLASRAARDSRRPGTLTRWRN